MAYRGDFSEMENDLDSEKVTKACSLLRAKQKECGLNDMELLASLMAQSNCLEHIPNLIVTEAKNPEEARNHAEMCCDIVKQMEITRQCQNPRQIFKQAFSSALKGHEKIVRQKIESKKIDDIRFVMAKANLVACMFDKDLTTLKLIYTWTKSVLKSNQNPFIRLNVLMIIRDRVKFLVESEQASNVQDLYDMLVESGCYDNYAIREQKSKM